MVILQWILLEDIGGLDRTDLVNDKDKWWAFVSTVMGLYVL